MAKGKDGGKPSERISDEVYSTPLVKTTTKVGMARRQRKTKKSQVIIYFITKYSRTWLRFSECVQGVTKRMAP